jgi:hypothetical protein
MKLDRRQFLSLAFSLAPEKGMSDLDLTIGVGLDFLGKFLGIPP